jgi:glycosyltransferase involved in cell wall biosynthesis
MQLMQIKNQPHCTVAMPFYNNGQTLAIAIRSILNQTYADFEFLLCNDGSTDHSLEIARSFDDPRIIVWSDGQRKALGARLNECLDRGRGFYFVRMDADDVAYPTRLERQVRFLEQNPHVDLVSTFAVVFRGEGVPLGKKSGPISHEDLTRNPLSGFSMWHPTWAGRAEWFRRYRYDPEAKLGQDQEFLYRTHTHSRFATLPEILLGYREESLRLKKMVRYRWIWWRHLGVHLHGFEGQVRRAKLAIILLVKVTADCLAVWSGLGYRLLRHRARPLNASEIAEWTAVWKTVERPEAVVKVNT